jgi:hypothetical protein
MRRLLALAAVATGLAAAGSAAACERHDPCHRPPPRVVYEHRYVEHEVYRPRVREISLPGDFFYGGGGVEGPVGGGDVYYGGGYVIVGGGASSFAGASAYASARTSVSVSTRFHGGYRHGGKGWGGHRGGGRR